MAEHERSDAHHQSGELTEDGKRRLEAGREAQRQSYADFTQRTKGKPTPTQEENDEAALGKFFAEHEADGGDPDPSGQAEFPVRHLEGHSGGGYQTRQAQPQSRPVAPASTHSTPPPKSPTT